MFVTRILLTSLPFFALLFVGTDSTFSRTGFVSNFMNDWNCRLNLMTTIDGFDSIIESYYNKSGEICKTYCRIRKVVGTDPTPPAFFTINAPEMSCCGPLKFCRDGECRALFEGLPKIHVTFPKRTPIVPIIVDNKPIVKPIDPQIEKPSVNAIKTSPESNVSNPPLAPTNLTVNNQVGTPTATGSPGLPRVISN